MVGELKVERETEGSSKLGSPPSQRPFPWLVVSLVMVFWAVFIYSLYKNNCPSQTSRPNKCVLYGALGRLSFQPIDENSQLGPAMSTLMDLGVLKWNFKKEQTKKWHILSSIFFHRGLASCILDTISLLYMGMQLEQNFGILKIGPLYFLSSVGGSLWAFLKFRGSVYIGGSSGVCGFTGSGFAELFINSYLHEEKLKRFFSLCFGVAINFTIKLFRGADVAGNIGGLYMGFLLGFLLLIRHPEGTSYHYEHSGFNPQQLTLKYSRYQRVLWFIALISMTIQFLQSLIEYILL